ncbi:hypothetical protein WJM97_07345 [Okeanomitos corallinicola TIOX110]|uniref:Carboxypeptidase regulatory-like domain-containing protein n=1 Tax=Okeanomitos corallinicola TIOX110 TaxID=3133117 RepID=A0ABZ2UW03_9CYAN
MSVNYTKWSFILGTGIAMATLVSTITIPEFRCFLGLQSELCPAKDKLVNIKLIIETEQSQPLEGVKVYFINNNGAPEIKNTNSDGYVDIRIPSTEAINIKLSKPGFETLNRTINLGIEPETTKQYKLKQTINLPTEPTDNQTPDKPDTPPKPKPDTPAKQSASTCTKVSGRTDTEDYSEDISVGRKPLKPRRRVRLYKDDIRSLTCRITQNAGIITFIYAIPDNSTLEQVNISFYLDGNPAESVNINRGSSVSVTLDTKSKSSYAIDYKVVLSNYYRDYLYFISTSGN